MINMVSYDFAKKVFINLLWILWFLRNWSFNFWCI